MGLQRGLLAATDAAEPQSAVRRDGLLPGRAPGRLRRRRGGGGVVGGSER